MRERKVPVVLLDRELKGVACDWLTTVMQPRREMGKLATELLVARVNGDNRKPKKHRLKTKLIIRGSSGISPIQFTN